MKLRLLGWFWLALLAALLLAACGEDQTATLMSVPGGDAAAGRVAIERYGCGSCHRIPGISGAHGLVGPPLDDFGRRKYIAGNLPNDAANLVLWIADPQAVEPGTVMPDMDVTELDARDIAAYLATLR